MILASEAARDRANSVDGFILDAAHKYYPNPVSLAVPQVAWGAVGNVISDQFETGLDFARARINLSYDGSNGSIASYSEITATSPIGAKAADTVTMSERQANDPDTAGSGYLAQTATGLVPNKWQENVRTGARADLSTASDATFNGIDSVYRFLVVGVIRSVQIDYVVTYDTVAASKLGADAVNKIALMLRMTDGTKTYSANAVTSRYQDSDISSGTYTVKFRKFVVPTDNRIYADTLLPSGLKASYTAYEGTTSVTSGAVTWSNSDYQNTDIIHTTDDGTYSYIQCPGLPSGATIADSTTYIKLVVSITDDPSWGIRDLTGNFG
jgi:hypothetical protein